MRALTARKHCLACITVMKKMKKSFVVSSFAVMISPAPAGSFVRPFHFATKTWKHSFSLHESTFSEPSDSNFGRQEYWNDVYETQGGEFSWYSGWNEIEPFVEELIPNRSSHVLIPGMGNDGAIVDMYDSGYHNLTAFDYAEAGVECAQCLMGDKRIRNDSNENGVTLLVADARNLPFENNEFDAVLDKGTLDAIYLSGGRDKELAARHLAMAVKELERVVETGGIMVSISAACVDAVQAAFDASNDGWEQIRDGSPYITDDGFASDNVDGTLLAWKRT